MRVLGMGVLLAATMMAACSSDDGPTGTTTALTPAIQAAVVDAIQDEYHAEETYLRVLADFGEVLPFYNVVYAEQRHSASLAGLLERRNLSVPESEWNVNNVPRFTSLAAACAGAAAAEVANIALYDQLLAQSLPSDVQMVFTNNRSASLTKHLPAFQNCQ
jgi:hypothetical protein